MLLTPSVIASMDSIRFDSIRFDWITLKTLTTQHFLSFFLLFVYRTREKKIRTPKCSVPSFLLGQSPFKKTFFKEIFFSHYTPFLVAVYYNHEKSNLFRIHVDVTLSDMKHQLNSCLHFRNQRRVTDVEHRCQLVCSDGTVLFINGKLQNDGDVRTMFSIFSQYMTKGQIELDAKLVRSVERCETSPLEGLLL
jgi:hypothetical protein